MLYQFLANLVVNLFYFFRDLTARDAKVTLGAHKLIELFLSILSELGGNLILFFK
jgi:hypothetical protein